MIKRALRDRILLVTAVCSLLSLAWFAYFASDDSRGIVLRNALIAEKGTPGDFLWTPSGPPSDFRLETHPAPPELVDVAYYVPEQDVSGFTKTIDIARHLLQTKGDGLSIRADTATAYNLITKTGTGYCGDYTQVFVALAHINGIDVREWGFALDDYGGGHAFNEIYDEALGKWVFVDIFSGFYVVDRLTGVPLSVLELRDALLNRDLENVSISRFRDERFEFRDEAQAWEFYSEGAAQMFLWWGNDVFSYESNALVELSSRVSRALEQFVGIVVGAHVEIRAIPTKGSEADWSRLMVIRALSWAFILLLPLLAVVASWRLWQLLRPR